MPQYIHYVPGRLRVKCLLLKRDASRAKAVTQLLSAEEGIASCEVNLITGSVLVRYDESATSAYRVLDLLKRGGYIGPGVDLHPQNRSLEETASDVGTIVRKALMGALVERVVERSAVALVGAIL
ncbi:MAG: HMA2 domain-containing protein [Gammaproteobacteria bacterium]|jgi:Heavy metal associated domain 2